MYGDLDMKMWSRNGGAKIALKIGPRYRIYEFIYDALPFSIIHELQCCRLITHHPITFVMVSAAELEPKRPIIIGNVAGAMEDCPYAM